jgi:hypothetical protein
MGEQGGFYSFRDAWGRTTNLPIADFVTVAKQRQDKSERLHGALATTITVWPLGAAAFEVISRQALTL